MEQTNVILVYRWFSVFIINAQTRQIIKHITGFEWDTHKRRVNYCQHYVKSHNFNVVAIESSR